MGGLAGQHAGHPRLELRVEGATGDRGERARGLVALARQHLGEGRRGVGELVGEGAEHDGPEGVEVGAAVDLGGALELLRRHEGEGAEGLLRLRERRDDQLGQLGDTEVEQFDLKRSSEALLEEDVGGLEVAVDDPHRVGVVEAPEGLADQHVDGEEVEAGGALEALVEGLPEEELEDDGGAVGRVLDHIEHARHEGRGEHADGAGFPLESLVDGLVLAHVRVQQLERDHHAGLPVASLEDLAHAAAAKAADHLVAICDESPGG